MARRKRRRKNSDLKYIAYLGGFSAALFVLVSLLNFIINDPTEAVIGVVVILMSVLGYIIWRYRRRRGYSKSQRFHAKNLGELLVLTPNEFEHAVGSLLASLGYRNVRVSGKAGDLMADITCQNALGHLVICQCKRYGPGNNVGTPEVQAFIGMRHAHYGAAEGIFVTTSSFTAPARALAQKHRITLMDGETLTSYMQQLGT